MKEEKYWVLLSKKLAGEATPAELEELRDMLLAHPDWAANMETLSEFWASRPQPNPAESQKAEDAYLAHINRLKEKAPDFEATATADNYESLFAPKPKPLFKKWALYTIAGMAALALLLLVYPFGSQQTGGTTAPNKQGTNEISIGKGSRTKIQLPDGSTVWINSGSKLTYSGTFSATTREVNLEGEAYFDVTKDPAHPFIVHTSGIDIKVLGTAFNIKAYTAEPTIEATLIHGAIEVTNKNQPGTPKIMLKPHEKLVFNKVLARAAGTQRATTVNANQEPEAAPITIRPLANNTTDTTIAETAWVYNKLVFEEERFEDLAIRMERWFNIKISIESDKLKNFKISGSFVNETAEEAVKVLQMLVPFRYTINKNEISIMRK